MSHISKIELEVKDLGTLRQACIRLGLNMLEGKKTFKWYGQEEDTAIMPSGSPEPLMRSVSSKPAISMSLNVTIGTLP